MIGPDGARSGRMVTLDAHGCAQPTTAPILLLAMPS